MEQFKPSQDLTPANVEKFVKNGWQLKNRPEDMQKFINLCNSRRLDPFLGDITISVYGKGEKQAVSFLIGVDAVITKAREIPDYAGHECIYIFSDGSTSSYSFPEDKLVGVCCKVYVKGFAVPVNQTALLSEYAQFYFKDGKKVLSGTWATHKSVMLAKCAIVLAHRRCYPMAFAGFYASEEMAKVIDQKDDDQGGALLPPPPAPVPSKPSGGEKIKKTSLNAPVEDSEDYPVDPEREKDELIEKEFKEMMQRTNSYKDRLEKASTMEEWDGICFEIHNDYNQGKISYDQRMKLVDIAKASRFEIQRLQTA
jgi:phage recombination protein Bet